MCLNTRVSVKTNTSGFTIHVCYCFARNNGLFRCLSTHICRAREHIRWQKNQQCNVLSFLSSCLPPLSFHYFLCMPLYLSFHRFTSFIGSSVFNFYRPWVFCPDFLFFFPAFISGLETCFKDFLSISLWLHLPVLVLYFIVFILFSVPFFDFPFLSIFTSFLFTVLNSFHHNLLYSYADVIFLPLFLMLSISQVRRSFERCYATVLNALLAQRNLVMPHVRPVLSPLTASGHLAGSSTGRTPEIFGCWIFYVLCVCVCVAYCCTTVD